MEKSILRIIVLGYDHGSNDDFYMSFENSKLRDEAKEVIEEAQEEWDNGDVAEDDILDFIEQKLYDHFGKVVFDWEHVYDDTITIG